MRQIPVALFLLTIATSGLAGGYPDSAKTWQEGPNAGFNFAYTVQGNPEILPLTVHNNGRQTYFRLPPGVQPTGAFVNLYEHKEFVPVEHQAPYWVVDAVSRQMELVTDGGTITAQYEGAIPNQQLAMAKEANAADIRELNSALRTFQATLQEHQHLARKIAREGATVGANMPAGSNESLAPASAATATPYRTGTTTGTGSAANSWKLVPGSLYEQLQDWCAKAGYQLVWESESDFILNARTTVYGPFQDAVRQVITSMNNNRHSIFARLYDNRVLVVSSRPQPRDSENQAPDGAMQ